MTTSSTTLFVAHGKVPSIANVRENAMRIGYRLDFPEGFELTDKEHSLWLPVVIDGTESGFDYGIFPISEFSDPLGETMAALAADADSALDFGARGQQSLKTMTIVQRAICDLSGAQGLSEGEFLSADEMIEFSDATLAAIGSDPQPASDPRPALEPARPASRLPDDYFKNIGKTLLLTVVLAALAWMFIYVMGTYFAPEGT